jgi:ParB/RepB/Spo0J family partition protein
LRSLGAVKKVSAGHAGRQHAISEIRIGNRYRRDLGDVSGLADSIAELGLLHPIVIRADGRLIAGERRLAACKSLGWEQVPVTIIDLAQIRARRVCRERLSSTGELSLEARVVNFI